MQTDTNLEAILAFLETPREEPSLDFLRRLILAYRDRVPFETATRLLRFRDFEKPEDRVRPPAEFWREKMSLGAGGSCSDSTYAFKKLLDDLGTFITEDVYEELSRIAPTVATQYLVEGWKSDVLAAANVFGKRAEAEGILAAFEGRIEEFKEAMGGRLDEFTASLVNTRDATDIRVYTEDEYAASVVAEAGVRRPEWQRESPDPDANSIDLSLELLPRIDTEVILYYAGGIGGDSDEEAQTNLGRIQESPLWQRLPAVENDRAYQVDAAHWFGCSSIQAANLVLDDLFEFLVEGE